ncbi:hypothetical protein K439DRAFT_821436 [Ramaria rubella]|nr:hypothetical protein K439DRAFT_821436 [Ramaria rubella]
MMFYFYTTFQNFVPLDQIFNFVSPAPDWAAESVRLVTYTRGKNGEYRMAYLNSLRGDPPEQPSAPMSRHGNESVLISWLKDQNYVPTFLPTTSMGPDNLTLLEFEDGWCMWMVAQVKCQQTGTSTNECTHAIKSVMPPFFHTLSRGETVCYMSLPYLGLISDVALTFTQCERLQYKTNEAMTSVPNLMPGNPVLRVIACLGECNTHDLSNDLEALEAPPLAFLNMEQLQDATCTGAVCALVSQKSKKPRQA